MHETALEIGIICNRRLGVLSQGSCDRCRAESTVSGWTPPDRPIRHSVGLIAGVCRKRLLRRGTRDFIDAFGRLPRLPQASLWTWLPNARVWDAAPSIAGSSAIWLNKRRQRWLIEDDRVVHARRRS